MAIHFCGGQRLGPMLSFLYVLMAYWGRLSVRPVFTSPVVSRDDFHFSSSLFDLIQ